MLCSGLGWPHLECCVWFWVPEYKKDLKLLESVQRGNMEMVKGLEGKPHMKCEDTWSVQLGKGRLRSELTAVLQLPQEGRRRGSSDLCSV